MRKFAIIALVFALFVGTAFAETNWHTANQTTVAWDHDLAGIPADQIKFNIYLVNVDTDPSKGNPAKIGTTAAKEYTITLNSEGRYWAGVAAFRVLEGKEIESEILWSDEGQEPFGLQYFIVPMKPSTLRLK